MVLIPTVASESSVTDVDRVMGNGTDKHIEVRQKSNVALIENLSMALFQEKFDNRFRKYASGF